MLLHAVNKKFTLNLMPFVGQKYQEEKDMLCKYESKGQKMAV